ncbi:protoporphyrinogen oxidase HemJ [Pseudomaricurvus alkylphenolicus]|jgi:putative membrane protein|uniref:protoporphyrinogen oxidase HemJ n=1 Tax=Pseudomaricurvus alkylphenolicus TaxID=1306991 RepID=UPI0014234712|nr:protoporphyrinogen oxidase HemJ [Pseudomaricurvus alkylphenolicus]NIB39029.1 protoporphyrinogen oxidase HemJ [Pseudomaricurvus alkylphenolicus]
MLWIKAFHVIFMVCWFAGIFYLPRLFVNHAMATDTTVRDQLALMERKLYRFITPFMVLTIGLGLWLASYNWSYFFNSGWFITKICLVFLLVIYHFYCGRCIERLDSGEDQRGHVFYRVFNELPVLILFAVVILVVVRPF